MVATTMTRETAGTTIHIERTYPHPRAKVWKAISDAELVGKWLMKPEGFAAAVGTKFILRAKPQPGWRGFVECEVKEVVPERVLRYSWVGNEGQAPMEVTFRLDDVDGGTRLTFDHVGFHGLGGWVLARFMMGPGWKKMLTTRLPAVLG